MIDLQGISYRYEGSTQQALTDIDLRVGPDEVVGVLGPNGSGKTTLLRICAGMMRPVSGNIRVRGSDDRRMIRTQVAFAPDYGMVYPFLTIREAGEFLADAVSSWDREYWASLLELFELTPERPASELSKGQRARLRLAQALAQRTPVLLLDEPLAGIDLASRERIARSLAADLAKTPRTVLMSTHEVDEVEALFSRVVLLDDGHVKIDSPADELRATTGGSLRDLLRWGAEQ